MNAGLGNLESLKVFLLSRKLASESRFDQVITDIGLGVAGLIGQFCNRDFIYGENKTQIFSGNRSHWYMPAYPISSFSKVELRYFKADNWSDITGQPISCNEETGLLSFGYTLGRDPIQVRVTWSGGYWFETLEPDDAGFPSSAPASILNCTAIEPSKFYLPAELRFAWQMQCAEVWNKYDALGLTLVSEPNSQALTGTLDLVPAVKRILEAHKRYELT